ncbi:helix-turn-helix transcriptional regulator [Mycolicibacterium peregrinum]|uniref:helix-turn-helix transcriptional regulator n=1 Tax=Mycolicibacterium peregrinum TaxID=43304 RepID=UPI000A68DBA8|nr:LuxR C-terminal-related transcriptional regulator [Mycolicibacterium peregrinum]
MSIVVRYSTVQMRVDAAGIAWLIPDPDERAEPHVIQRDVLDALTELIGDVDVRTIVIAGLPLAMFSGLPSAGASPVDVALAERLREVNERLWSSSKTLIIRRHVEGATLPAMPDAPAYVEPLTERELQVLSLASQGVPARQIGDRLFISERTVESHVGNAYRKLGIRSRGELVRRAVLFGF